ncbi:MAG: hypothetical protein Q8P89_01680 [bacterium]|nr:hypothetical protein [bacterium]
MKEVDGLAFRKRIKIRFKLSGEPGYGKVTSEDGESIEEEYYSVPIFYRSRRLYDPVRMAIHEVRHRVQHNHPEIQLFTVEDEDLPDEFRTFLHTHLQPETAKKLTPRETDAQIFDELAYPVFLANNTDDFLQLLFHGTNL